MPDTAPTPTPGTPHPAGPATDAKPTGSFSTKTAWIVIASAIALIFFCLTVFGSKPKPKKNAQQRERQQAVSQTTAAVQTTAGQKDYLSQLNATVSPDALRAEDASRRGTPPPQRPSDTRLDPRQADPLASLDTNSPAPLNPDALGRSLSRKPVANARAASGSPSTSDPSDLQNALTAEAQKRDAQSLFSELIVINNRLAREKQQDAPPSQGRQLSPDQPPSVTTSTNDRSRADSSSPRLPDSVAPPPRNTKSAAQNALNNATGPAHKLFEGTILESVLTNRLNGTYTGPVNCMVTTDVWSHNRQHLLIPRGSRLLGDARQVNATGQQRLAVTFHRIVMPDGYSVSLDKFVGMNGIGETGLKDKVDNHYRQIFGVSVALGAIAGLATRNTSYGANASGADAWRQGMSQSLSQEATQVLDRYLNILPTIMIREGARVNIYLTDDLMLPSYDAHRMSSDL